MSIKKNIYLLVLLTILSTFSLYAQEICDDGIDNDGNGLIDLNDPACPCSGTGTTPSSLIPNPSFEDMLCCPADHSQLTCADTWIQASDATSDYFNTCDYVAPATPLPFPDGNGAVGFFIANMSSGLDYLEYLGAALSSPLVAGTEYQLEFDIAFRWTDGSVNEITPLPANPSCPIDITIYGTPNAGDIPWAGDDCPIGVGGFVELGHVTYSPDATADWGTISISFTPTFNVTAVVIGGPCTVPVGCGYDNLDSGFPSDPLPYFFADNLILNESASFNAQIGMSGDMCTNDLILSATSSGVGTYQWYYEGIAIAGETGQNLAVSAIGGAVGDYQVTYTEAGICAMQDTIVTYNTVNINVSADATICEGDVINISANGGDSYIWDNSLPALSNHNITPLTTTTYGVTASNSNGCTDSDNITITVNPKPIINITGDTIICDGESTILDAGVGYDSYLWNHSGETTQTISVNSNGIYSVSVTNSFSCSNSNQVNVIVNPNPIPNITGNTIICPNLSTILDAGSGFVDYNWSNSNITQTSEFFTQGMSYVTVTDINSCTGIDSLELAFSPQIIPNVQSSNYFACIGDDVQLSATGAGAGGSYIWDQGLGVGQIHSATITGTTAYFVTLTDVNNCTEIDSLTITGVDVPVLNITPIDTVICKGSSLNISVSGAQNYSWFPSYGLSPTVGSVVIASPEVSTIYNIIGTNELGGTVCSATIQSNIEVDEYNFTLPIDKTFCKNEEVAVTASVSGGVPPYSYLWTINGSLRIETSSSIMDTIIGDRIYQLIGVDGNGCSITRTATFKNFPQLVMNPYINEDTVCPNAPVLFNAQISGGTGAPYEFVFDGHYSNTILTVYPKNTYLYQLVVRDGCEEIKDSITIATYPIPYLDFIANEYGGCQPKEIKFSSISSPANLIDSYRWNFGDNDQNNLSITASPSHIYESKGTFDVNLQVLTVNGCFTDTTKERLIHIEAKPKLNFKAEPSTVSILKPIVFFNNTSDNVDSLSYIWNFGTGDLSNITSPEYRYNSVGNYEIELIGFTAYGCSDTIYKYIEVKPEVKFYIPDAFTPDGDNHNEIFIPKGTNIINKGYHLSVYDRWGEPIFETDNLDEGWDGKTEGGSYAKPGIYAYYIIFRDIYDINYEREGTLNLIR